ncbi:hypothetical protein [Corynebacterium mucifaciens]|uniref:Uncharacterized protein n=1 Tax=Corynebacterium mucifaciens TaxID=57171 RepID=A0A7X6LTY1_9CORY|nr:hypothetical protein [Corynebacterium mucifaciens]NKY69772.1 hypothetical protein [Corynebacterium mucifaciens]
MTGGSGVGEQDRFALTGTHIDQLIFAHDAYMASANDHYDDVLREVSERIAVTGSAGKTDIAALVCWKRLNASTIWVKDLMQMPEHDVREATGLAFQRARSAAQISEAAADAIATLHPLPGLRRGRAVASAVLAAGVPERMAVYDRRAHASLQNIGIPIAYTSGVYSRYMSAVEALRDDVNASRGLQWRARDVELALYWMSSRGP